MWTAVHQQGGETEGVRSNSSGHGKEVRVMSNRRSGGEDRGGSMMMNKEQKHLWAHALGHRVGNERTETMCRKLCETLLCFAIFKLHLARFGVK